MSTPDTNINFNESHYTPFLRCSEVEDPNDTENKNNLVPYDSPIPVTPLFERIIAWKKKVFEWIIAWKSTIIIIFLMVVELINILFTFCIDKYLSELIVDIALWLWYIGIFFIIQKKIHIEENFDDKCPPKFLLYFNSVFIGFSGIIGMYEKFSRLSIQNQYLIWTTIVWNSYCGYLYIIAFIPLYYHSVNDKIINKIKHCSQNRDTIGQVRCEDLLNYMTAWDRELRDIPKKLNEDIKKIELYIKYLAITTVFACSIEFIICRYRIYRWLVFKIFTFFIVIFINSLVLIYNINKINNKLREVVDQFNIELERIGNLDTYRNAVEYDHRPREYGTVGRFGSTTNSYLASLILFAIKLYSIIKSITN